MPAQGEITLEEWEESPKTKALQEIFQNNYGYSRSISLKKIACGRAISEISIWLAFLPILQPTLPIKSIRDFMVALLKQKDTT